MNNIQRKQIRLCNLPSSERTEEIISNLINLWNASVRASHHFLTEEDILNLTPYVDEAIRYVTTLFVTYQENIPVAFLGLEKDKIEMLFVSPTCFGKGIGKQLVRTAIEDYHVCYVDVNEQNPQAVGFYRHLGFHTFERTETDEQGNLFPILKMQLSGKDEI